VVPFSGQLFLSVALSAAGYKALGIEDAMPNDRAFTDGMRVHGPVTLFDPDVSTWDGIFQKEIHAMLIIAHDTDAVTRTYQKLVLSSLPDGVSEIGAEVGAAISNPAGHRIEHFGYADGVSSPVFFRQDLEGHTTANWNPLSGARLVLAKCPAGDENSFGSYLVFRKLEQNVKRYAEIEREFHEALRKVGAKMSVADAGAQIIGRRKDGTSLMVDPGVPSGEPISNDFDYVHDPAGTQCPFGSHTRKLNPRGGTSPSNPGWSVERERFVVRRGITYGQRKDDAWDERVAPKDRPEGGVGLLFICYQASIQDQFEKLQMEWANNGWFPRDPPAFYGVDALIGQRKMPDPGQVPTWPASNGQSIKFSIDECVKLKGGEYFFTPSLRFFRSL
jgi:Dyp-type peroxidase family